MSADIEDVAGNSLRPVFDAEMIRGHAVEEDVPSFLTRRFAISGKDVGPHTALHPVTE